MRTSQALSDILVSSTSRRSMSTAVTWHYASTTSHVSRSRRLVPTQTNTRMPRDRQSPTLEHRMTMCIIIVYQCTNYFKLLYCKSERSARIFKSHIVELSCRRYSYRFAEHLYDSCKYIIIIVFTVWLLVGVPRAAAPQLRARAAVL